jgi:hypothetical protein
MKIISIADVLTCSCCQNLHAEGDYAFGADLPAVANDDSFYIRKSIRENRFELAFESEAIDNSFRIEYCPVCGNKLR